jgi:hypothetical protein
MPGTVDDLWNRLRACVAGNHLPASRQVFATVARAPGSGKESGRLYVARPVWIEYVRMTMLLE